MSTSSTSHTDRAEPRIDPDFDPEVDPTLPSGERSDSLRRTAPWKGPIVWLVLLMALAASAVFFYPWRQNPPPPPAPAAPAIQPPVAAEAAPAIRHPIENAQGAAANTETKPLPALMVSDTTMQNTLADLFGP